MVKKVNIKGMGSNITTGLTKVFLEILEEGTNYTKTVDVLEIELEGVYTFSNYDLVFSKVTDILNQEGFNVPNFTYTPTDEELQEVFKFKNIAPDIIVQNPPTQQGE